MGGGKTPGFVIVHCFALILHQNFVNRQIHFYVSAIAFLKVAVRGTAKQTDNIYLLNT